jgi:prepilin-type N-terminal cleavage/methylation domain-containing protein
MRDSKGFTTIELTITIALIGIFALITIPNIINTLTSLKLNLAAAKMASDIRYARELAVSYRCIGTSCLTDKKCGVEFFTATNSYQVFCLNGASKVVVTDPMKRVNMVVNYSTQAEFAGVTLSSASACAGASCATTEIRIDSFGRPYDGAGNAFTAPATATLTAGSSTKTVRVIQDTGLTEIV